MLNGHNETAEVEKTNQVFPKQECGCTPFYVVIVDFYSLLKRNISGCWTLTAFFLEVGYRGFCLGYTITNANGI